MSKYKYHELNSIGIPIAIHVIAKNKKEAIKKFMKLYDFTYKKAKQICGNRNGLA